MPVLAASRARLLGGATLLTNLLNQSESFKYAGRSSSETGAGAAAGGSMRARFAGGAAMLCHTAGKAA